MFPVPKVPFFTFVLGLAEGDGMGLAQIVLEFA
jgi:hypothetical protein